jgi:PGF-pre-PGF domain-containing protein
MRGKKLIISLSTVILLITQFLVICPVSAFSISSESILPTSFSPDGNSLNDSITITFDSTTGQTLYLNIFYNSTQLVRGDLTMTESPTGTYRATWNGKDDNDSYVTDEGTYTIRASDVLGSGSGISAGTTTVDLSGPTSPSISIEGGAAYSTTREVNLTISATSATKMKISNYANYSGATWENYATSKSWQLTESDGSKTVYVNFRDQAGANTSASSSINLDSTISTPSLSINSGNSATNLTTVTLSITATDATNMKIDNDTDFTNMSSWISKASTYEFTMPSGADGSRTVYLRVKDEAGNVKTTSDSITLDTQAPTSLSISINDGAANTNNRAVSLNLSASGGPQKVWISNNASVWTSYDYSTSLNWNISTGDGTKTVYYKASDSAGNNATAITASISLDTVNPSQVTLSTPTSGATLSSQTPTFEWSNPNQQSQTRQFFIEIIQSGVVKQSNYTSGSTTNWSSSTLSEGSYSWQVTVYDLANNSATASQQSFTISVDGLATPSLSYPTINSYINDTTPRLRWSQVSGQGTINYDYKYGLSDTNLSNTGSTTSLYVDTTEYTDGQTIYWSVRARNTSTQSNYSNVLSFSIDTTAPTLNSISISSNANYSTSQTVTISLSATGASWMKLSENSDFSGASWEAYSSSKSFSLSSGDGTKTIYFIAKDGAVGDQGSTTYANINYTALNDTIILDTEAPTISNPVPSNGGSTTITSKLTILASLSDAGMGIDTSNVAMIVDGSTVSATPTSSLISYVLSTASLGTHTVNITAYDLAGRVSYYNWTFEVTSSGGVNPPGGGVVVPVDAAPVISAISHNPSTITSADIITINATVVDDTEVLMVNLYWNDGELDSKEMTQIVNTSTYTATIGPFEGGITVTYYIQAVDNAPQTRTSSNSTFSVEDNKKPTISIISPSNNAVITDKTPEIYVTFYDAGGINIDSIKLLIDDIDVTSKATVTSSTITYTPDTALSYSKHTITLIITDNNGNSETQTWSFTIDVEISEIIQTVQEILIGQIKNISFSQYDSSLENIRFTAAAEISEVTFTYEATTEKPSEVTTPTKIVYMYLVIDSTAESDEISSAVLSFKIEQSWFTANNYNKDGVVLLRYHNNSWQTLTTTFTSEDDDYVYFEATTPGFSVFAVIYDAETEPAPTTGFPLLYIILIIIIVAIATVALLVKFGYIYIEK